MRLPVPPYLETKIRARAESEGRSIEARLERLVHAEQQGTEELEALALPGSILVLRSSEPLLRTRKTWSAR